MLLLSRNGSTATASQFDLPSLMTFSVAGCGRLHLGVANWATSVASLQEVDD